MMKKTQDQFMDYIRSLCINMIFGVSEGYVIEQELVGVGYRAKAQGQNLELSLGYSHPISLNFP